MTTLRDASLADIVQELRRRTVKRPCSHCGGSGLNYRESTVAAGLLCPHCGGSGYEFWPELEAGVKQLEAVITGTISIGSVEWPVKLDDALPNGYWEFQRDITSRW